MVLRNAVHKDLYADSVALMRVASRLAGEPGVDAVSLVMGTPANREVLAETGMLTAEGRSAAPNDLIVAVRGTDAAADAALAAAVSALRAADGPPEGEPGEGGPPLRSLAGAPADADLALISTPGAYAAAEARKALRRGLHAFVFSDHVPLADEVELKREAARRGLLVMGPDCGTAVVGGVPLGFANAVRRGGIGLVGASGTGLQQVSTLLHDMGAGVSHIIGTGSRDVSEEVGGLTMRAALDALAADPATDSVVLVSKPPAPRVAEQLLRHMSELGKPAVVCFLGWDPAGVPLPHGVTLASTLYEAARAAAEQALGRPVPPSSGPRLPALPPSRRLLRALYAGGTFAHEAGLLLGPVLGELDRSGRLPALPPRHLVLDLGDDEFTAGRPHPMIDPGVRTAYLRAALADPATAVVVLDVVIGYGAAADPAAAVAATLAEADAEADGGTGADRPAVLCFVVGTDDDPQGASAQRRTLREAGAVVVGSSTEAALACAQLLDSPGGFDARPAHAATIGGSA
ncbi:acyl-CoA synthetase FdrA [Streptomyces sp. SID8379]|uniref:acyl-CoA synthetase FdrA n=1 Tax=unclassified Streptomyces TaxID=2593676 RepID=UPI000381EA36|nr:MULTISPECIES: acyl-CoA synthetase FdrA [unclassified Streptomyces]MYW64972.1 acyl-CoA synthetase FdrA [Streptomyces sp. SID8379]